MLDVQPYPLPHRRVLPAGLHHAGRRLPQSAVNLRAAEKIPSVQADGILLSFLVDNLTRGLEDAVRRNDTAHARHRIDVRVAADDRAGVEHAVAADLDIVAEDGADLLAAGLDALCPVLMTTSVLSLLTFDVIEPAPIWAL